MSNWLKDLLMDWRKVLADLTHTALEDSSQPCAPVALTQLRAHLERRVDATASATIEIESENGP